VGKEKAMADFCVPNKISGHVQILQGVIAPVAYLLFYVYHALKYILFNATVKAIRVLEVIAPMVGKKEE
jgi:hypothetical protein